jgi:hypothetical protein
MVIASPTRTKRSIRFQHSIHDSQRIFHEWLARLAKAIPHQFEEPAIYDVLCRELPG